MKIVGVDLSSSVGLAALQDAVLVEHHNTKRTIKEHAYPYGWIDEIKKTVQDVVDFVEKHQPDLIVIEETNMSRQRYSQKILEFLHAFLLEALREKHAEKIRYVDTGAWRKSLGIVLSKDERKNNKTLKNAADPKATKKASGIKGKITPKHLAVAYVNEKFGLDFKLKDNDRADAICLALAAINGVVFSQGN